MNFFKRLFHKETQKEKIIRLLEVSAAKGDLQAEQVLKLYKSLDSDHSCPIHSSIHGLKNAEIVDDIIKGVKTKKIKSKNKSKKKNSTRRRNPKNQKNDK